MPQAGVGNPVAHAHRMVRRFVFSLSLRSLLLALIVGGILTFFLIPVPFVQNVRQNSATFGDHSAGVTWSGSMSASTERFDAAQCTLSGACDILTLNLSVPEEYRRKNPGFVISIRVDWEDPSNNFDLFLSKDGRVIESSAQAFSENEEVHLRQPINGIYHVITHSAASKSATPYSGSVNLIDSLVNSTRAADYIKGALQFHVSGSTTEEAQKANVEMDVFGMIRESEPIPSSYQPGQVAEFRGTQFRVSADVQHREILVNDRRIATLTDAPDDALNYPTIAIDRAGGLHVVFIDGGNLFLESSADSGRSWKDPVRINDRLDWSTRDVDSASVIAGDSGRVGVTWQGVGGVFYAFIDNAFAPAPTVSYTRVEANVDSCARPFGLVDPFGNAVVFYGGRRAVQVSGGRFVFGEALTRVGRIGLVDVALHVRGNMDGSFDLRDSRRGVRFHSARVESVEKVDGGAMISGRGDAGAFRVMLPDDATLPVVISLGEHYQLSGEFRTGGL
jgi:hypothetical protein